MTRTRFPWLISLWIANVVGHGHVSGIVINGAYYQGYGADSFPYNPNAPIVIGWTIDDKDNGFVAPASFGSPDIICHRSATPAQGHARAAAGDIISFIWNTWPDSHVGPVYNYLAPCHGPCETVDKTKLEFFKIDGPAYISGADPGHWAPNVLISKRFTWQMQLPLDLLPGNYVLRHEIIALHAAMSPGGAQAYPQCINLEVTGNGTNAYDGLGTLGVQLYKEKDPGIVYNIYQKPHVTYINPGPPLVPGLPISISQGTAVITATSKATTTYGTDAAGPAPSSPDASPAAAAVVPAPNAAASSSARASAGRPVTTARPVAPAKTTLTKVAATKAAASQQLYGQCGGTGWSGPQDCGSGATCSDINPYYSQCIPA